MRPFLKHAEQVLLAHENVSGGAQPPEIRNDSTNVAHSLPPPAEKPRATPRADRPLTFDDPNAQSTHCSTCYMCACRCGIKVTLENGRIRFIQGNPDHPVNQGVLCAKGSAGIQKQYSAAKLRQPLLRKPDAERGAGEFEPISWERALDVLSLVVPFGIISFGTQDVRILGVNVLICLVGLLIERWLFFAEAQHVVRLFHGQQTV